MLFVGRINLMRMDQHHMSPLIMASLSKTIIWGMGLLFQCTSSLYPSSMKQAWPSLGHTTLVLGPQYFDHYLTVK